jgi:Dyp-type peroxidase family
MTPQCRTAVTCCFLATEATVALRDLLPNPLDTTQPDAQAFAQHVQGNILKGHARAHTAHLFLTFDADVDAARAWIAGALSERLVSAAAQDRQTQQWKATAVRDAGEPFFGFYLSYQGYVRLGIADGMTPADPYFRAGMKAIPASVGNTVADPSPRLWERDFQGRIDAMILAADDDRDRLDATVETLTGEVAPITERSFVERGDVLHFDFGDGRGDVDIEHFGHQDGISQPRLIKKDIDAEIAARGGDHWNPGAPLSLCFVEEPDRPEEFGSYFVFRKLGQNVNAFHTARDNLAQLLGVSSDDAAALAVGRRRDGHPVMPSTAPQPGADANDFNFSADAQGAVCPFQAHIRKTNPRGDIVTVLGGTEEFERSMRIVRRGIPFGDRPDLRPDSGLPAPENGVGLLFMCYQSQLLQFVIQQEGSDSNDFVKANVGPDATLGNNAAPVAQQWPVNGTPNAKSFEMTNFVTMLGGEYFFTPSLTFLAAL